VIAMPRVTSARVRIIRLLPALVAGALALTFRAHAARADELRINKPGAHPTYNVELEPHALLGFIDAPGPASGPGIGAGFRGTIKLVDNGFVPTINNSIGVGIGFDWVHFTQTMVCQNGAVGTACLQSDNDINVFFVPVVMQWNFWLSRNWSVFGEIGPSLRIQDVAKLPGENRIAFDPLSGAVGGRWHFSETASLTLRAGYPSFSVGVSFLL
jgi:hypothetical protein